MEYRLWTLADQMRVKPISDNNVDKFTQLQLEVEYNDIVQYLGAEFYQELKRNLANYTDLMNGGTYLCDGVSYEFAGLKTMFCYLLYARYVRGYNTFYRQWLHINFNFLDRIIDCLHFNFYAVKSCKIGNC